MNRRGLGVHLTFEKYGSGRNPDPSFKDEAEPPEINSILGSGKRRKGIKSIRKSALFDLIVTLPILVAALYQFISSLMNLFN